MDMTSKVVAPKVPRDEWASHPHFPSQVLLLGSHEGFRRVSRFLVEQAQGDAPPEALRSLYRRWIAGMRSHEAYEEHKLYPYLALRWQTSFETCEAGHHALHEAHAGVLHAFEARLREPDDPGMKTQLVDALRAHDEVLQTHLGVEEEQVIPMLLSLSPTEFRTYASSSIGRLLESLRGTREE